MVKRAAFTLIELIFAIVIMSIVFLSLPSLSSSSSGATETSMAQEAIFPMSARLSQILSYKWDQNSDTNISSGTTSQYAKVVDVVTGHSNLKRVGTSKYRVGHIQENNHRQFHERVNTTDYNVSAMIIDGADDIDDFDTSGTKVNLLTSTGDTEGYKKDYKLAVDVDYFNDTPGSTFTINKNSSASATNMKIITLSLDIPLSDGTTDTGAIVLRSYAANIGEVEPFSRRY
jgi:prepilin-type N-terminal cleavage/methylation domain-containing protein